MWRVTSVRENRGGCISRKWKSLYKTKSTEFVLFLGGRRRGSSFIMCRAPSDHRRIGGNGGSLRRVVDFFSDWVCTSSRVAFSWA